VDCVGTLCSRFLEGGLELIRLARLDDDQLYSQLSPGLGKLPQLELVHCHHGIHQHGDP